MLCLNQGRWLNQVEHVGAERLVRTRVSPQVATSAATLVST